MDGGRKESGERWAVRNKWQTRLMARTWKRVWAVLSLGCRADAAQPAPGSSRDCSNLGNVDFLSYPLTPPSPNPSRAADITPVECRKKPMLSSCLSGYLHRWAGAESQGHLLAPVWQG